MSDLELKTRLLGSWENLNKHLHSATVAELKRATELELSGKARPSYVRRFEQRVWRIERDERQAELTKRLSKANRHAATR